MSSLKFGQGCKIVAIGQKEAQKESWSYKSVTDKKKSGQT